jgi:hypothetical protein
VAGTGMRKFGKQNIKLTQTESTAKLHKRLWKIVSEYSRGKDATGEYASCVTCGYHTHWKELQAGHFIRASKEYTKYFPNNIHAQCPTCNGQLRGNIRNYTQYMLKRYGENEVETMRYMSNKIKYTWTEEELNKLIDDYKNKLKEMGK